MNTVIVPEQDDDHEVKVSPTGKPIAESTQMLEIDLTSRRTILSRTSLPVQVERGFTLLELLVVIVIIGLLAGYVGPKYFAQIGKSQIKVALAQIDSLDKTLDQYRLDTGHYPSMEDGLVALVTRPASEAKWDGPYLKKAVPLDPWGNPYVYRIPGEHGEYDLLSYGKDGQPGGEGEAADITNW